MMGREGSSQKHSDPKVGVEGLGMQEICVMLKLSVKVGNPGNREDGLTGQIIADIFKYFCLFV